MAHVAALRVYPVKGLDGEPVDETALRPGGTLAHDRAFALVDPDSGDPLNAKDLPALHEFATAYDRATRTLTVAPPAGDRREFDLGDDDDRAAAGDWFGERLDAAVALERDDDTGFVDRPSMGPSVVSTATLEAVASWFDDLTVDGARRRLRANVEVGGVPAFWEDRFVGADAPDFTAGGVRFEGVTPCNRCVVPSRDPDTGDPLPAFRETFLAERERSFPEWADWEAFDHYYAAMILARAPEVTGGETLAVGDDVAVSTGRADAGGS
jgi:uncharacterized protein YcbX